MSEARPSFNLGRSPSASSGSLSRVAGGCLKEEGCPMERPRGVKTQENLEYKDPPIIEVPGDLASALPAGCPEPFSNAGRSDQPAQALFKTYPPKTKHKENKQTKSAGNGWEPTPRTLRTLGFWTGPASPPPAPCSSASQPYFGPAGWFPWPTTHQGESHRKRAAEKVVFEPAQKKSVGKPVKGPISGC